MRAAQSFLFLHPSASREPCVTLGQEGLMLFFFSCVHNHEDFALVLKRPHSFKPATPPNLGVGGGGVLWLGLLGVFPQRFLPPSIPSKTCASSLHLPLSVLQPQTEFHQP